MQVCNLFVQLFDSFVTVYRNEILGLIFYYIAQHIFPRINSNECIPCFKMIGSPNNQIHNSTPTTNHSEQSTNSDNYGPFFHSQYQTRYGTIVQYGQTDGRTNKQTNKKHTYIHTHTQAHIKHAKKTD